MRVLHLARRADWAEALVAGSYDRSSRDRTLAEEGFVHASTRSQLPGVVDRFYADADLADHLVLVIDAAECDRAGSTLRWENPPGSAELFPHFYGPIPVTAVVGTLPLSRDDAGLRLPDFAEWDVS